MANAKHIHHIQVVPAAVLEEEDDFTSYLRAFNDRYRVSEVCGFQCPKKP